MDQKINKLIALFNAGRYSEAEHLALKITKRLPNHGFTWKMLGVVLSLQGRKVESVEPMKKAANLLRTDVEAYYNLGVTLKELGRLGEAETSLRHALELSPDAGAYNTLGVILADLGRLGEAETCYRWALKIKPDYAIAHNNLGFSLKKLGRTEEAETSIRRALEIDPYFADAYNNLGFLLSDLGRLDEAEANLRQALEIKPDYGDAHNNLGNLFKKTKRFAEAKSCYLLALAVSPNSAEVNNNLGNLFAEERDFAKAEACYRHALAIHPDCAEVRWSLGLLLLFLGRFAEGWPLYDVRYSGNWRLAREWQLDLPYPRWMGEDLRGKTIAVWPEQGYGDEIQFVRYLSHLRSLGATRVTLVCKSALKSLFLNSVTDSDQILSEHEVAQLAHHDFWTTSLSLPLYFKTTLETIPSALPYLFANSDKAKLWAEKFSGVQLNIGLVWKGATGHQNDANRSLQGLLSLAPLWSVAGASFVSLQKGVGEEDASAPPSGQPILNLGADIKDFSDTAAIVSQLDLVICVDTAIAHLAAALGKPCWVLLPMFGIDWRWMDKRADSPWYPGVMRLFRQTEAGDWDEVVQRVTVALERLAAEDTDTANIE